MSNLQPPDRLVRAIVADADRRRRWRDAVRLSTHLIPFVAGAMVAMAVLGRLVGGPRAIAPALLGVCALAVALALFLVRRPREATLRTADLVDHDADLGGELASAFWFDSGNHRSKTPGAAPDPWVSFHIERAATHASGIDWQQIYAPPPVRRPLATGVILSVLALAISFVGPARERPISASKTLARTLAAALNDAEIAPATKADLEALIATLERGDLTADDVSQASELIDMATVSDPALRERLQDLLAKAATDVRQDVATANLDRPASEPASDGPPRRSDDSRSASEEWARDERAAEQAAETAERRGDASSQSTTAGNEADADRSRAGSPGAEARDMVAALGASQVTLGDQVGDTNGASGYPMGGRSNGMTAPSVAITLPEVLAREVVEAHDAVAGADVKSEEHRRQAEQAASGLTSTGSAARLTFDRAHVAPPSPVPEARRTLIEGYFARP